ncbi:MAG: sugar phosphate isomerase/epimerase [Oscillospiraceae bacterium]|nr:sugar phosphate isomerase/epimerase [Oscillospiraceae bacterium]
MKYRYSIFTKPYKDLSMDELGKKVVDMGFSAIEYPLRDGFQVKLDDAENGMAALAKTMGAYGVSVSSVAATTDEWAFAACQAAGCKILRIMARTDKNMRYLDWEKSYIKQLEGLEPLTRKYGVTLGIQNHCGPMLSGTMELKRVVEKFDPKAIAAIWDAGHSGLAGEDTKQALDIIWDNVCLINFKNAYYRRVNGPEAPYAKFHHHFTLGRHGFADYPKIAAYMIERGYEGDICLPAEYTDEALVDELAPIELAYVKSLFE